MRVPIYSKDQLNGLYDAKLIDHLGDFVDQHWNGDFDSAEYFAEILNAVDKRIGDLRDRIDTLEHRYNGEGWDG
jgi:hypothetical protein